MHVLNIFGMLQTQQLSVANLLLLNSSLPKSLPRMDPLHIVAVYVCIIGTLVERSLPKNFSDNDSKQNFSLEIVISVVDVIKLFWRKSRFP